jgi:hypothetical protein
MIIKSTGIKACIAIIFLLCIQINNNTLADEGCFGGFSSLTGEINLKCDPSNPSEINPRESKGISVIGKAPLYLWEVKGSGFSLEADQTIEGSNILHADSLACGTATITVSAKFGEKVGSPVACSVTCGPESDLKWNFQNPGGMVPNTQVILTVLDGMPPFKWELTQGYDKGFSLDETETGSTCTLTANADICGAAEIKVTDSCSGEVNGSVKAVICTGVYAMDNYWEITPYTVPYSKKLFYYRTFYDCGDGSFVSREGHSCVCASDICERIVRREYVVDWDNKACSNPTGYNMCGNATYCLRDSEHCGEEAFWCAGQVYIDETPCDE